MVPVLDIAQVRFRNAQMLFDEYVRTTVTHPDAAALRGLERRFAERLQIQPSYWSQIKSRARQIGERLARQFEARCHKPVGWMDIPHDVPAAAAPAPAEAAVGPQNDDERFIVSLVLSYYRRDPRHAKTRLLALLGEVLAPAPTPSPVPASARSTGVGAKEDPSLWAQAHKGVAPLKRKR
jgi:hypothetical protein